MNLDASTLARRQLAIDRDRTRHFPHLLEHKLARMLVSPFAFLRGAAPLFYEVLRAEKIDLRFAPGAGWIVGDAHLENFGAYRPDALSYDERADRVLFNLNDFDDAAQAPWALDVIRLCTSLILAGREMGCSGHDSLSLCEWLLDGYAKGAFSPRATLPQPGPVSELLASVKGRSRAALLDSRTELSHGHRHFELGERYQRLPRTLQKLARAAFAQYVERLPDEARPHPAGFEVIDLAFRVAGTGSLGSLRIAVLTRGKDERSGAWLFDMKEERDAAPGILVRQPKLPPAERVKSGLVSCLEHPPAMVGITKLGGRSMLVRRLAPQEDRSDYSQLDPSERPPLMKYLGLLLGRAHRLGAELAPRRAWGSEVRERLASISVRLAGIHEAVYLELAALTRR